MNEEQNHLINLLKSAVTSVYLEKRPLSQYDGKGRIGIEQAFAFRVGVYLNYLLKDTKYEDLDLDAEYNKYKGGVKKIPDKENAIRPDLILHERNSDKENKMVVEFKGWWNNDVDDDFRKLEDLTSPEDNYHYLIGVFVKIGKDRPDCYKYFVNGKRYE